ncbi:MAG: hypothetical protein GX811_08510, partial [Lentisphaerae bacterium]|nr:hypothetical protein [Lentisphaerota bacterium]
MLNLSYVITSSADFYGTLDKVVDGLNCAGFSSKDYRVKDTASEDVESPVETAAQIDMPIFPTETDDIPEVDISVLKAKIEASIQNIEDTPSDKSIE